MRASVTVVLAISAAVVLTSCGGSNNSGTAAGSSGGATTTGAGTGKATARDATRGSLAAVERAVVRTAELGVRVNDVRAVAGRARAAVTAAGGELAGEDAANSDATTLRLRVPEARFDAVLAQLGGLGDEQYRRVTSEDVTEQVIDLDSRVATQKASVARVRALLARANSVGEVVQVEGELTKREADLESLQARLSALGDRAALSSITLALTREPVNDKAAPAGFRDGLRGGWDALGSTARVAALAAGILLPFLPLVAAGWFALRLRSRRRTGAPATP